MRTNRRTTTPRVLLALAASAILTLAGTTLASAAPVPGRFLLGSYIGHKVNKTTGGDICTIASKNGCVQPLINQGSGEPEEAGAPGAFNYPRSVAVSPNGNVYVADSLNHRIQELDSEGHFVMMFGREVNATTKGDVCTEEEIQQAGVECQQGVMGSAPGQFAYPESIAVDPVSGDVYVAETLTGEVNKEFAVAQRVQKFTAMGVFVAEIGKEVNQTTKENLCTAGEACTTAALQTPAVAEAESEPGAFSFARVYGNLLAVGGPKDRLYVGDHARVQEFEPTGAPAGEISLGEPSSTGKASGVAVDPAGDVFVALAEMPGVREYNTAGVLQPTVIGPTSPAVRGLALDPHGRLGILVYDPQGEHGYLYSTSDIQISEFAPSSDAAAAEGLAFAPSDELYVVDDGLMQLESYTPAVFPESRTCGVLEVTGTTAKLCGEVDPDGVPATGFFQYGASSALGSLTAAAFEGAGEAFAPVSLLLSGLVPNEEYQYRLAVEAQANGEQLQGHGENVAFHTAVIPPQIPGQPSTPYTSAQSAILSALVDPEHTATRYHFEFGACPSLAACATVQSTPAETSSAYGAIGVSEELAGLTPATTYSYRLVANNEFEAEPGKTLGGKATGIEGTFTTSPAPEPSVATAGYSGLTPTSAVITGLVNPDGVPASYALELGVYNGASTQYGIIASGSPGTGTTPVEETLALTGLQPSTTYAYRIAVSSGYIDNPTHTLQGATAMFTTGGLPSVLALPPVLAQLPVPSLTFPRETTSTTTRKKGQTRTQQLAKALKACKRKPKQQRVRCERDAHDKYGGGHTIKAKKRALRRR
jgi:DNA-binding beta-propeller fold protein YncE